MTTNYFAVTYFYQNDQVFRCTWDFYATYQNPSNEELIDHYSRILEENNLFDSTWSLDEEDGLDLPLTIDLFGLTPNEFARELVMNTKEAINRFGLTWKISTDWDEADYENGYVPTNL